MKDFDFLWRINIYRFLLHHIRKEGNVDLMAAVLIVLIAITLLVGFPVYASIISVPLVLARNVMSAMRGEIAEEEISTQED